MIEANVSGGQLSETELLEYARAALADMLGAGWEVDDRRLASNRGIDAVWRISGPDDGRGATVIVEAQHRLSPAAVERSLASQLDRHRKAVGEDSTVVVVAPWLSPRARQVLEEQGISYLDTTGNVSLRIREPAVIIRTEGDQRDPDPPAQARRGISGPQAGRIVRQLVDFQEPRRANELARAADISESYTSRLLDILSDEVLIQRKNKIITKVDWQNLLRARAGSYQLMRANRVISAVARRGLEATLDVLRDGATSHPVLMTGTMAANGYAPLVIGGSLMLYVPPGPHVVDEVMQDLGLLRSAGGAKASVQLLQPMSVGALDRPGRKVDGVPTVGLSQLVLDCLNGPGRMPAAGNALLEWMETHDGWRLPSPFQAEDTDPFPIALK